jgi:uncharacterized protein with NRDE domain
MIDFFLLAKDLMKGREGGTWIAMNRNGKLGVLLNILQPNIEISDHKKPRGLQSINSNYGFSEAEA